jgi:glycosyltransferase 2 family protein
MSHRRTVHLIGIAIGLALFGVQLWQGTFALLEHRTCVVRPVYLGGALALYGAAYAVQMTAWALIMRGLGARLGVRPVIEGYLLAFLPRYIPGSVWGYLSRGEWLAQTHGIAYGTSTVASLIEVALPLLMAAALAALVLLSPWLGVPLALVGLGAMWAAWALTPTVTSRLSRGRIAVQPDRQAQGRLLLATTALYALFWLLHGAGLVAVTRTLCGEQALTLSQGVALAALSWAVGFVVLIVPAGFGVREWALGALLVAFAGFAPWQGSVVAVVSRLTLIAAELLVLLVGLHSRLRQWWAMRRPRPLPGEPPV